MGLGYSEAHLIEMLGREAVPIFPMDLFRNPAFSLSSATAACAFTTQGLAQVALPFLFNMPLGRSQTELGFLIAPWPLVGAMMAPITLSDRIPAGLLGGLGLSFLCSPDNLSRRS